MLAPIITKDMKLFPSRPLPTNIKNVRSRAQSLDQFSQLQNSNSARGRVVPVKPRNSVSTGNLPSVAKSPPSTASGRKSTLSAIQEGVEMKQEPEPTTSSAFEVPTKNGMTVPLKKMTPTQAAKIHAAKQGKLSTGSSSDSASDDGGERKENKKTKKKSVVKWLTSAFRKNSREEVSSENLSTISS